MKDLHRAKHDWQMENPGTLTLKRIFVCERCGTRVQCRPVETPDSAARNRGIPDDCDEAVAYNIHVA